MNFVISPPGDLGGEMTNEHLRKAITPNEYISADSAAQIAMEWFVQSRAFEFFNARLLVMIPIAICSFLFLLTACVSSESKIEARTPATAITDVPRDSKGGIAYIKEVGMESQIWRMDYDGQHNELLVADELHKQFVKWSPNGDRLAYIAKKIKENVWSLWLVNADGSEKKRLTEYHPYIAYNWLSDDEGLSVQEIITFTQHPFEDSAVRRDYIIGLASGVMTETQSASNMKKYVDFEKSPDEQRAAAFEIDNPYLLIVEDDTYKKVYKLPEGYHGPEALAWSPNGQYLAFSVPLTDGEQLSVEMAMFIVNADGTNLRKVVDQLDHVKTLNIGPINWSPDGNWIAFAAHTMEKANLLCVFELKTLQSNCLGQYWIGGTKPYWTSNSQEIVIITNKVSNTHDIYSFSIEDGEIVNLTKDEAIETELDVW